MWIPTTNPDTQHILTFPLIVPLTSIVCWLYQILFDCVTFACHWPKFRPALDRSMIDLLFWLVVIVEAYWMSVNSVCCQRIWAECMCWTVNVSDWRLVMVWRSLAPSQRTRHCGRSRSTWVTNCMELSSPSASSTHTPLTSLLTGPPPYNTRCSFVNFATFYANCRLFVTVTPTSI